MGVHVFPILNPRSHLPPYDIHSNVKRKSQTKKIVNDGRVGYNITNCTGADPGVFLKIS